MYLLFLFCARLEPILIYHLCIISMDLINFLRHSFQIFILFFDAHFDDNFMTLLFPFLYHIPTHAFQICVFSLHLPFLPLLVFFTLSMCFQGTLCHISSTLLIIDIGYLFVTLYDRYTRYLKRRGFNYFACSSFFFSTLDIVCPLLNLHPTYSGLRLLGENHF